LTNWADTYNNIIDWENPNQSGFKSLQEKQDFQYQGVILAKELQQELGISYQVLLFDEKSNNIYAKDFAQSLA
jgi:hypothetical protein